MQAFTNVTGAAAPLMMDNVDTDVIVRIERLTGMRRDQLGPYAMEALRYRQEGGEDPAFVLNKPVFREAPILLAGRNFGCGSSREGAVWALQGRGIRCVIAESFGDIFFGNCFQNGLLPVAMARPELDALAALSEDGAQVTVDLERSCVMFPDGHVHAFEIDAMKRAALLDGRDEIERTLLRGDAIDAWQLRDRAQRPWLWTPLAPAG